MEANNNFFLKSSSNINIVTGRGKSYFPELSYGVLWWT